MQVDIEEILEEISSYNSQISVCELLNAGINWNGTIDEIMDEIRNYFTEE